MEDGGSGTRDSGADGALVSVPSETPKVLEAGNRGTISRNFMDLCWPLAAAGALFLATASRVWERTVEVPFDSAFLCLKYLK